MNKRISGVVLAVIISVIVRQVIIQINKSNNGNELDIRVSKLLDRLSIKKEAQIEFLKQITEEMLKDGYTGKGTYTYASGSKYVGEWKDGKMHGQGALTYADGTVNKGLFENGKFLGE